MAARTDAQEEFDNILSKASAGPRLSHHRADSEDYRHDRETGERDEEDEFQEQRVDAEMRTSALNNGPSATLHLPHRDFDMGRTTGVKGVIADARSYEEARTKTSWKNRFSRSGSTSRADKRASSATFLKEDGEGSASEDEEFLERWRQQRRMELQGAGKDIRNRRTSPSMRRYGRFDEVDALGYLDAIEKVGRDTIVLVFVYDPDCPVSQVINDALEPLVSRYPVIHFVKVHYEEIEFDNAGVPAVLGYKNQGDLFANLTYIIDQIPDNTEFDTRALENIFRKNHIL